MCDLVQEWGKTIKVSWDSEKNISETLTKMRGLVEGLDQDVIVDPSLDKNPAVHIAIAKLKTEIGVLSRLCTKK